MTQYVAADRVAEMAAWCDRGDPGADGSILLSASVANEHASDLRCLLAKVAEQDARMATILDGECACCVLTRAQCADTIAQVEIGRRQALARVAALEDSNEGLTADLRMAVQTAYNRGATEWARLNYPQWAEWLDSQKGGGA